MSRPNFYLLLGLDPAVSDPVAVQAAIKRKRAEWSRDCNNPIRSLEARQNLQWLTAIPRVLLSDPTSREAEAQEARRLVAEARRGATDELDETIKLWSLRGYVLESEAEELARRFKSRLGAAEIRARIPVPVVASAPHPATSPRQTLDPTLARDIRDKLRLVGKPDLYVFLDCPRTSSREALEERARMKDTEARQYNTKTAEVTAAGILAGHCLSLFKSDDLRERYDNTLAVQGLLDVRKLFQDACRQTTVLPSQVELLVQRAGQRGVAAQDAIAHLLELAALKTPPVPVVLPDAGRPLQQCGPCGAVNDGQATACALCGEPLLVACPKCSRPNPSVSRACPGCGFAVGNAPLLRQLEKKAAAALACGDSEGLVHVVAEAEVCWPGWPGLQQAREKVQSLRGEAAAAGRRARVAVAERRLVKAQSILLEWRALGGAAAEVAGVQDELTRGLEQARRHVACAEALLAADRPEEALEAYGDALRVCTDLPEALDGLERCPPPPPRSAQAVMLAGKLSLCWEPPASQRQLRFRVVRTCLSSAVATPARVMGETDGVELIDDGAEPGQVYRYMVFSLAGNVPSTRAAETGPVVAVAEVLELKAHATDGQVVLSWKSPPGLKRVEVRRASNGAPGGGGVLVPGATRDGVIDTSLENGMTYGYRVLCVFAGPQGEVTTGGVTVLATPGTPPPWLTEVQARWERRAVVLSWSGPPGAVAAVFRLAQRPDFVDGQVVPLDAVSELGPRVPSGDESGATDPTPTTASPYYAVFSQKAGQARYCGTAQFLDITELTVHHEEDRIALEWGWPSECPAVVLAPAGKRPDRQQVVRRGPGEERGRHTIWAQDLGHGEHTLRIRCVVRSGERAQAVGPGRVVTVRVNRPGRLHWELVRGWSGVDLVIRPDGPLAAVKSLTLVGRINRLPDEPEDGEVLARCVADVGREVRVRVKRWEGARGRVYCRLFAEPADAVVVEPPPLGNAVL